MSQEPKSVQLVSDGDGTVVLIVDGKPDEVFFAEYNLPERLIEKITKALSKYGPWGGED